MDCGNDNEMCNWNENDYCLQKDGNLEIAPSLCDEDGLSHMFQNSTPVRACGDVPNHAINNGSMNKEMRQYREASSQGKRRRVLQFDEEVLPNHILCEEMPSPFLKSKEKADWLEDAMSDVSQWVSGFADDTSVSGYEGLDQSSNGWLADCFNDIEMHYSPDDLICGLSAATQWAHTLCGNALATILFLYHKQNLSGVSDVLTDSSESCYKPPGCAPPVARVGPPPRTRKNIVIKGGKSYTKTPTKLASSIVCPFAFIKPSEAHGDVTLKDINQRIKTPKKENDTPLYPTSAFSGKPVVGKTKIRTEGGKGSITIMRTIG